MTTTINRITFKRLMGSVLVAALISGLIALGAQIALRIMSEGSFILVWSELLPIAVISTALLGIIMLIPANKPARFLKNLGRIVAFVLALVIVWVAGAAWIAQNFFMFPPVRTPERTEQELAADPHFERVLLPSPDGEYSGWLWKNAPDKGGLLFYFGGNGEEATSIASFSSYRNDGGLLDGYNVLMMDNPGYGRSDGNPSEESIYQMAKAAYDFAQNHPSIDKDRIILGGWSLGTGTALRLAAEKSPAGLLLLSPFYNGKEMVYAYGQRMFDLDFPLPPLPIRNPFKSNEYAKKITCPTLIIAVKDDRMIPFAQSERLSQEFSNAEFFAMESGGHGAGWYEKPSVAKIKSFLNQFAPGTSMTPAQTTPATVQP